MKYDCIGSSVYFNKLWTVFRYLSLIAVMFLVCK